MLFILFHIIIYSAYSFIQNISRDYNRFSCFLLLCKFCCNFLNFFSLITFIVAINFRLDVVFELITYIITVSFADMRMCTLTAYMNNWTKLLFYSFSWLFICETSLFVLFGHEPRLFQYLCSFSSSYKYLRKWFIMLFANKFHKSAEHCVISFLSLFLFYSIISFSTNNAFIWKCETSKINI